MKRVVYWQTSMILGWHINTFEPWFEKRYCDKRSGYIKGFSKPTFFGELGALILAIINMGFVLLCFLLAQFVESPLKYVIALVHCHTTVYVVFEHWFSSWYSLWRGLNYKNV